MKKITIKSVETDKRGNYAVFNVKVTKEDDLFWYDEKNGLAFSKLQYKQTA